VFEAGSGANAIMAAYHLVHALQKLEAEWNERAKKDHHFKTLNHPINFNPGIIKGGDWASSVPAWCDVDCRIAVLPGWSIAECSAGIVDVRGSGCPNGESVSAYGAARSGCVARLCLGELRPAISR
jgi:acetylornithine deacetylase/succinyl-diaminopimelate desuccinylase-like protein